MKIIPYLDIEELGVCWRVRMNFRLKHMSLQKFIKIILILSIIFPFVNDAEQLKQAITVLRPAGFHWENQNND